MQVSGIQAHRRAGGGRWFLLIIDFLGPGHWVLGPWARGTCRDEIFPNSKHRSAGVGAEEALSCPVTSLSVYTYALGLEHGLRFPGGVIALPPPAWVPPALAEPCVCCVCAWCVRGSRECPLKQHSAMRSGGGSSGKDERDWEFL